MKKSIRRLSTIICVLAASLGACGRKPNAAAPTPPAAAGSGGAASPERNPIVRMLRPPRNQQREDGVAVAILVDVSGSMRRPVAGESGREPKIAIARRCVQRIIEQVEQHAREHPDSPILLGLYEFSDRPRQPACRVIVPLGEPDPAAVAAGLQRMRPDGGTPIGDAMIAAKRDLDATGLTKLHVLIVTDGENTQGYRPEDVASAMNRLAPEDRPSLYFVAFDIAAETFDGVKDAGGLVLPAAGETELRQTLDYVFTGKILAEQP